VGKVTIGDEVFVGYGTIILPNVRIGSRVVVGAGSVVTRDIPDNSVAAGNPAKVIGTYDDFLKKHSEQMKTRPVYHTLWSDKTWEEKEQMRRELVDGIGYDL
jgi:maltose O-acetyltransferase